MMCTVFFMNIVNNYTDDSMGSDLQSWLQISAFWLKLNIFIATHKVYCSVMNERFLFIKKRFSIT
ncbi:hypothetical protein F7725_025133 [Dissostichus mawsoni]|uniref:Uncharacterized protein n=1 Tax=Dissostichus mawsoni TaxID=36200 RepID=A0A7J5XB85_DISMA|nr:hypothetical protein F7725_025133 [Dissostichus mawsoni]